MLRSASFRVLIALVAGLLAGAAIQASGDPRFGPTVEVVEAVGGLWLNALRMTIVPLVFALLVTGIASAADAAATGRMASRTIGLFLLLLVGAAVFGTLGSLGLLAAWPVDGQAAAAFVSGAAPDAAGADQAPTFVQWLGSLAPTNPIKAAAETAILPLVVFGLFFGFALTRIADDLRTPILTIFRATAEAMIVVVRWVMWAAPVGVFGLAMGVGARAGIGAAGVLAHYVAFAVILTLGITVIAAILAVTWGRVPVWRFAPAAAPVWAVAFSTQSSLASLPVMVKRSRDELKVPERVIDLVLPLAVAVFRITSPVTNLAVAFFVAALYGLEPSPLQMVAAGIVSLAISIGSVGLPNQSAFFASMAPICLALGVPLDLLPILLAVEVIPDIFRTVGNVTGDLAVATIIGRENPSTTMEEKATAP